MLNQTVLVGRLINEPTNRKNEGKSYSELSLAIPRSYKNSEGMYETDFIKCTLLGSIAESTIEYCKKGDVIGVKGRLQTINDKIELIAERVTFLTSQKKEG